MELQLTPRSSLSSIPSHPCMRRRLKRLPLLRHLLSPLLSSRRQRPQPLFRRRDLRARWTGRLPTCRAGSPPSNCPSMPVCSRTCTGGGNSLLQVSACMVVLFRGHLVASPWISVPMQVCLGRMPVAIPRSMLVPHPADAFKTHAIDGPMLLVLTEQVRTGPPVHVVYLLSVSLPRIPSL